MGDWIVLDGRLLVQVVAGFLMVARGEWLSDCAFSFCPEDVTWVLPGRPLESLLPLCEHESEIRRLTCFE